MPDRMCRPLLCAPTQAQVGTMSTALRRTFIMPSAALLALASCGHVKPVLGPPPLRAGTGLCGEAALLDDAEGGIRTKRWVAKVDAHGSMIDARNFVSKADGEIGPFRMDVPGAMCSAHAAHMAGYLAPPGRGHPTHAVLGMTFANPWAFVDASRFSGIGFFARRGPGTLGQVRVNIMDVNTDERGQVCRECYNAFGKDIEVGETWQWYTIPFADLEQAGTWGNPRPPYLAVHALSMVLWSFVPTLPEEFGPRPPGEFDLWIDDVQWVGCAGGPTAPVERTCTVQRPSTAAANAGTSGTMAPAAPAPDDKRFAHVTVVMPKSVRDVVARHSDCGYGVGALLKRAFNGTRIVACEPVQVGELADQAFRYKLEQLSTDVRIVEDGPRGDEDLVIEVPSLVVKDVSSSPDDIYRINYTLELAVIAKRQGRIVYQKTTPVSFVLQFPPLPTIGEATYLALLTSQPPPGITAFVGKVVRDIVAAVGP
jgi:hypothetical protein